MTDKKCWCAFCVAKRQREYSADPLNPRVSIETICMNVVTEKMLRIRRFLEEREAQKRTGPRLVLRPLQT